MPKNKSSHKAQEVTVVLYPCLYLEKAVMCLFGGKVKNSEGLYRYGERRNSEASLRQVRMHDQTLEQWLVRNQKRKEVKQSLAL